MSAAATSAVTLAVTGSTGWLGGLVAGISPARGARSGCSSATVARAPELPGSVAAAVQLPGRSRRAGRPRGRRDALHGVGRRDVDRLDEHRAFVDAAAAAGVRHLVYVSFFGAAPDATFTLARDHAATEQHLRDSGMAWTFLRDNLYLEFMDQMVGADGVIRGPAGDGRPRSSRTTTSRGPPSPCCSTRTPTRARPTT